MILQESGEANIKKIVSDLVVFVFFMYAICWFHELGHFLVGVFLGASHCWIDIEALRYVTYAVLDERYWFWMKAAGLLFTLPSFLLFRGNNQNPMVKFGVIIVTLYGLCEVFLY